MNAIFKRANIIFVLIVLVLAGVAFFFIWSKHESERNEEKPEVQTQISVPAVKIVSRTLFREDQLPGEINAYQDVLIYPKVPGFVKWIGVDRGSVVKEGQAMVRMYAPEYLARRNEALGRVAAAKADLAAEESRLQDLKAELKKRQANLLSDESTYQRMYTASLVPGVIADNDVVQWSQNVEADRQDVNTFIKRVNAKYHEVSQRRVEVEVMEKNFETYSDFASYLEINAPFDGYVTDRKMHVGSFVGPDGSGAYPPICRVKQLDLLRIVAPVPEAEAAGVVVGSKVQFSVSSFPDQRFVGNVARISNDLDKDTRTMPVELNFLNPKYTILPGMFCKVYWPTRRRESSLFAPISSVVSSPLNTFVCRIRGDEVEWVNVRKGQLMGDMVEIFGNIHEGDVVAKDGSEELINHSKVKPIVSEESDPSPPNPPKVQNSQQQKNG